MKKGKNMTKINPEVAALWNQQNVLSIQDVRYAWVFAFRLHLLRLFLSLTLNQLITVISVALRSKVGSLLAFF